MFQSQNPKFRMDETAFGTDYNTSQGGYQTNFDRNHSAIFNETETASFSAENLQKSYKAGRGTAIIQGGGINMYKRLLNDSTENLMKPTALAIGAGTTKVSTMPWHPSQAAFTTKKNSLKNQTRQLASANIKNRRPVSNAYHSVPQNMVSTARAKSSQGHRLLQQRMKDQHN